MRCDGLEVWQLIAGWNRYMECFGEPPHGTRAQLSALLELIPDAESPAGSYEQYRYLKDSWKPENL